MKRLGLDFGGSRIGVAACDETGTLAFARSALERRTWEKDLAALGALARAEQAEELVVGLPLNLDGSEGPAAAAARRFARRAGVATGLPVVLWDERLSSVEAAEALRERGFDARSGRSRVDAEAARVILQRYLDHLRVESGR